MKKPDKTFEEVARPMQKGKCLVVYSQVTEGTIPVFTKAVKGGK